MPCPVALSLGVRSPYIGGPILAFRGSSSVDRWTLRFGGFPVGRQARVYGGLGCLAFRPFILLVVDRLRVAPIDLYSHSAVTPMTMGDDLLFYILDAEWKAPFIPAVVN